MLCNCVAVSSSYGATHINTELPQRQSYASSHTLSTYTTSHHPTGENVKGAASNMKQQLNKLNMSSPFSVNNYFILILWCPSAG